MVADKDSVQWSTMIVIAGNGMTVSCALLCINGHMPPLSWCSTAY